MKGIQSHLPVAQIAHQVDFDSQPRTDFVVQEMGYQMVHLIHPQKRWVAVGDPVFRMHSEPEQLVDQMDLIVLIVRVRRMYSLLVVRLPARMGLLCWQKQRTGVY